MTVYIIKRRGDETGLVKVGFSADLTRRLKDMSTSSPEGFDVIRQYDGYLDLEAEIHDLLQSKKVSGEWFLIEPADLDACDHLSNIHVPTHKSPSPFPTADDEYSDNIVLETRFYLNELVKREWQGMGDTVEMARDRLMDSLGIQRSYGFRLWSKFKELNDVSGDAYRSLRLAYALALRSEGRMNDNQYRFLRTLGLVGKKSSSERGGDQ
ncbi:GIY-YIG nuclease family protein [Agrobacterium pusense]|uniref:GIY-YIG nuclease family protein n=1 Tax=Agrobacterium pusense TaxID=648995 RepID=UPI001300BB34|nr:GIY-YIG nuclease family protein [Agrobacterium pusense]